MRDHCDWSMPANRDLTPINNLLVELTDIMSDLAQANYEETKVYNKVNVLAENVDTIDELLNINNSCEYQRKYVTDLRNEAIEHAKNGYKRSDLMTSLSFLFYNFGKMREQCDWSIKG